MRKDSLCKSMLIERHYSTGVNNNPGKYSLLIDRENNSHILLSLEYIKLWVFKIYSWVSFGSHNVLFHCIQFFFINKTSPSNLENKELFKLLSKQQTQYRTKGSTSNFFFPYFSKKEKKITQTFTIRFNYCYHWTWTTCLCVSVLLRVFLFAFDKLTPADILITLLQSASNNKSNASTVISEQILPPYTAGYIYQ